MLGDFTSQVNQILASPQLQAEVLDFFRKPRKDTSSQDALKADRRRRRLALSQSNDDTGRRDSVIIIQDAPTSADDTTDREHASETEGDAHSVATRATTPSTPCPEESVRPSANLINQPPTHETSDVEKSARLLADLVTQPPTCSKVVRSDDPENDKWANLFSTANSLSRRPSPSSSDTPKKLFAWQHSEHGSLTAVYGPRRTLAQKRESLTMGLVPLRGMDGLLNVHTKEVTANGIHVFLDMSNISINFQKALKAKHGVPDHARMVPLPSLNLSFLTDLLVRGRETKVRNVGCSVQPGRREPPFIQELYNLDYRVDLRQRKRVDESDDYHGSNSNHRHHKRYVEDLVDETLQTRIGESAMKHFKTPGTLVLATGDAKPAPHSDGFLSYADYALQMGWNVEVVSWRASLSSAWRNPAWADQWGQRLRVIELDEFLDELTL